MTEFVCVDIGSTFTKVIRIGADGEMALLRTRTRIGDPGWAKEVMTLIGTVPRERVFVSSSAGGGLRLAAAGLTRHLTTEAARTAALSAGARLVGTFAGGLAAADVAAMSETRPDVVLLAGGVDGGDRDTVIESAGALARSGLRLPVVFAGNRLAAADVDAVPSASACRVIIADNVMPEFGRLAIDSARNAIASVYMTQIVAAKGIAPVAERSAHPAVPTPSAVLNATQALVQQHSFESVMVVDPGGATVDVHSFAVQEPNPNEFRAGLRPPDLTRTVEGDLGLKWNAAAVVDTSRSDFDRDDAAEAQRLENDEAALPEGPFAERLLGRAVSVAVRRHCGRPLPHLGALGVGWAFEGKDCRAVRHIVGTGGPFRVSTDPDRVLESTLTLGEALTPQRARLWVDREYGLIAAGLLANEHPKVAARVLERSLTPAGAGII
jgi:uncharacterized protein (TIGR01319 family)